MSHFADRLLDGVDRCGTPLCVGVDPVVERLPPGFPQPATAREAADALATFGEEAVDLAARHVACVKIQSACFERYGVAGCEAFHRLAGRARERNLLVIADVKRGDVGTSAAHYAAGWVHPADDDGTTPDAITVNAYFGGDGLTPFLRAAAEHGRGVFALVRTSNPGGDAIQERTLADGRTVADAVGGVVAEAGDTEATGRHGYSVLGAVVAATRPEAAARLRNTMPRQLFLVPGFGAQGGGVDDVRPCFHSDGRGAVVAVSRSITEAWRSSDATDWREAVEGAMTEMKRRVADAATGEGA